MARNKNKLLIAAFLIVVLIGAILFSYQKIIDKEHSLVCAKSYVNLLFDMYEAEKLLNEYVENEKIRAENKHLIRRHLKEARVSLQELMSHSGESELRIQHLRQAVEDWERYSEAVISAISKISKNRTADNTGEIPAFSKLSTDNFILSMFIAFSTFSNLEPEPPIKSKENIKLDLSKDDSIYLSGRLQDVYKEICVKEKSEEKLSGIEWSLIGTKNFIDDPSTKIEQIIHCKENN